MNIIITQPNGNRVPISSRRTVTGIVQARQNWSLNGVDTVDITVVSRIPQQYNIGDQITVFGRDYKLNRIPSVRKTGEREYEYSLQFEGVQYDLFRVTYDVNIDTTTNQLQDIQGDSLTGNLKRFLDVLVANANRVFPGKWKAGMCPATMADKTLTFGESDNCLSVLQNLCSEDNFNVEFEIRQIGGVYTINLYERVGKVLPFTFEYGKGHGLMNINRDHVSSSNIVTRLKVFGSSENITSKYRASRLCLPGKTKGQSYIEKPEVVAKYGIFEGRKDFNDIKPTFTGSIESKIGELVFVDSKFPFDLNAKDANGTLYLMAGTPAKIHFNTGNLAGYEFDIVTYDHTMHQFKIRKITDERGNEFPSSQSPAFQFAIGDEYKVLDIAYSPDIEAAAEQELLDAANKYYDQNCQPRVQYSVTITPEYLKTLVGTADAIANVFTPGDYLHIIDKEIGVDKSIRIKSFVRDVLLPYSYSLTIADDVTDASITNRVVSDLNTIDKIVQMNNLNDPARARANWRSSREVLDMVFDADGDYYTDKIKPNSIDTAALSVGAKSMQFSLTNTVFQPNYNGNPNSIKWVGGVLTHYTIKEDAAVVWTMADGEAVMTDNSAVYVYAKCEKIGSVGVFILTSEQIRVDDNANYYHFLVGTLSSVDALVNARSLALTYGFTTVNGRFIKTGRIESADGKTFFDLDNSEIGGKIVFRRPDGTLKTVDELGYDNTKTTIDGGIVTSGTIEVASDKNVLAGMTGNGIASNSVRFWAGVPFTQRATAPFRVLQSGDVISSKLHAIGAEIYNEKDDKMTRMSIVGNHIIGKTKGVTDLIISNEYNPGLSSLDSNSIVIPKHVNLNDGFNPPFTEEFIAERLPHEVNFEYRSCELINYVVGYVPATSRLTLTGNPEISWVYPHWLAIEDGLTEYTINNLCSAEFVLKKLELWVYVDGIKKVMLAAIDTSLQGHSGIIGKGGTQYVTLNNLNNNVVIDEGGIVSIRLICPDMIVTLNDHEYDMSDPWLVSFVNGTSYPVESGDWVHDPYFIAKINSWNMTYVPPVHYNGLMGFATFQNGFIHKNRTGIIKFNEDVFEVKKGIFALRLSKDGIQKSVDDGITWITI